MIRNDEGLRLALEQLAQAYQAVAAMRAEHPNARPEWLALMAEGFLDHARQQQREIEEYTGACAAAEDRAELWLTVTGRGITAGEGPSSVLTALLDAFRKGIQTVAEFLEVGQLSRRPTSAVKEACDWRVVALCPGSLQIGVRLPDQPAQGELWGNGEAAPVRQAVREFLEVADWAAGEAGPDALAGRFPEPDKRRVLLNAVKPLAPRPRGSVESVTLSGRASPDGRTIRLTRTAPPRLDAAIDHTTTAEVKEHTGDLREIDLDNLTMTIRNTGEVWEVRCSLDKSLLEAAKEALDRRVKVSGVRESGSGRRALPTLHVFRLEVLEETVTGNGSGPDVAAEASG